MKNAGLKALVALCTLLGASACNASDDSVHAIVANPATYDHRSVALKGTAEGVRETTSRRRNDYTTFKLRESNGSEALSVFIWGHPTLGNGDCIQVEGVFEVEHRQGQYTFRNELEATKLTPCPR